MNKDRTRSVLCSGLFLALLILPGCGASKSVGTEQPENAGTDRPASGAATYSQSCTASFHLYHETKPFDNEQIAVFPMVGGKISASADKKLGSGKTDSAGKAAIEFKCAESAGEYVFIWEPNGNCCSMLRNRGDALSFLCGGAQKECELGKMVFQVFEFGIGG
jgi:hypothetical protein